MRWLVGIVMAIGLPVLLADLNDVNVCQWLATRLIRCAALRLPKRDRSRWEEEWLRHNEDVPGRLLPLARALKIFFRAGSWGRILRGSPSVSQTLRARMRAAWQKLRLGPKAPATGPEPVSLTLTDSGSADDSLRATVNLLEGSASALSQATKARRTDSAPLWQTPIYATLSTQVSEDLRALLVPFREPLHFEEMEFERRLTRGQREFEDYLAQQRQELDNYLNHPS